MEFDADEVNIRAWLLWAAIPIGHANVGVEDGRARLFDIVLVEDGIHPFRPARFLGVRVDYRGRGAGAYLLDQVVLELRRRGIVELWGEMQRAQGTLPGWYRRTGFDVNESTGLIRKRI
ncbi:GNAT family N-acetyltransferase [Usitatibacter rugosus]|uniref:GNAT family N-acetyltransferase n=1 Tax=Usitatibacter rugosus TaxID=2732067 RepID=UPI0014879CAC|nr:GNAT family N-acetyltransferase [Usitatibacter rugosus]